MSDFDVIVVGGGAAGIMAAGIAAEQGKNVLLLEKMNYIGRKLGITGKGRCNITNTLSASDFIQKVYTNGNFLEYAFSCFFNQETIKFFNKIGVKTIVERGQRVFPENGKAVELVRNYSKWCKSKNVTILTNANVLDILTKEKEIIGVKVKLTNENKESIFYSNHVIVTTGGASYPATGSTGDGYKLAKKLGHKIIDIRPCLVPIEIERKTAQKLSGLELKNVRANILVDKQKVAEDFGEMNFTDTGLSGPIILSLSRIIVDNLRMKKNVELSIDLKPALSDEKLKNRISRDFDTFNKLSFKNILPKFLPRKLISYFIEVSKIQHFKLIGSFSSEEKKIFQHQLKNLRFKITGHRDFNEAIITAGGVDLSEVDNKTMESKLIKGLYFAGEILDLDAPTGGYNLQIAFSTGWLAGKSVTVTSN